MVLLGVATPRLLETILLASVTPNRDRPSWISSSGTSVRSKQLMMPLVEFLVLCGATVTGMETSRLRPPSRTENVNDVAASAFAASAADANSTSMEPSLSRSHLTIFPSRSQPSFL